MKYLTIILLLVCFALACKSQAVTIDHESAPVQYYRMPDHPLDPSYTTYSAGVEARFGTLSMTGYSESSLVNEYLELSGYKEVSRDGDVQIIGSIGDFNVFGERTVFRHTKRKDKDGKEITNNTYAMEVRYTLPVSLKITDRKGKVLEDQYIFSWTDEKTWTSSYYNSLSDLDSYWRFNRISKLNELQKDRIREGFSKISDLIKNKYGYRLMKENARFETIGKKKHPLYEKYQQNAELIKESFKSMDPNKGLNDIKNKIKPALDFYNAESKLHGSHSKDEMKIKHIDLYNQALAYFWLEDFDQAEQFAREIQKLSSKDKDAKRLLEDIDYTRSSLEIANRKSRHGVMVGGKT